MTLDNKNYDKTIDNIFAVKDKVIVITGAAGFLGKEIALTFLENKSKVALTDLDDELNNEKNKSIISEYNKIFGNNILWIPMDVTKEESINNAANLVYEKWKKIDVLFNNAAIDSVFSEDNCVKFENYPLKEWNEILNVNLTGVFLCSKIIGAKMAEQGKGNIINISSIYGNVAPNQELYRISENEKQFIKSPAYCISKTAIHNLTKYIACYYKDKIRANTLVLGGIKKEGIDERFQEKYSSRTPMKRMMNKNEISGPILFLASDACSYMTGAELIFDGGFTVW